MPRTAYVLCSGICLLLTTALWGQDLPHHPTAQQIARYHLQRQGTLKRTTARMLPPRYNASISPTYSAYTFSAYRLKRAESLPTSDILTFFSIRQLYTLSPTPQNSFTFALSAAPLQRYLAEERKHYANWMENRWWYDPANSIGSDIIRNIMIRHFPPPPLR